MSFDGNKSVALPSATIETRSLPALTYVLPPIATSRFAHLCRSRPRGSIRERAARQANETLMKPLQRFNAGVPDNDETLMTNGEGMTKSELAPFGVRRHVAAFKARTCPRTPNLIAAQFGEAVIGTTEREFVRHSSFGITSSFVIRHSSFC